MMQLPIFLDLRERACLVVGGGPVAARKIALLIKHGARVSVVAPEICSSVMAWREEGQLQHFNRRFNDGDLDGCHLVFAATDDANLNALISKLAQARRIPVNVVDNPALCSFIMPSIIDRNPVQVAVSTGGASPVLARLLRVRLETLIPSSYGRLAQLMARFRSAAKARFPDGTQRRRFWEDVLHGPIAEMLFAGREAAAETALEQALNDARARPPVSGEVYLVGGGPGDPDLLTFRALRLMQQADVVVYDRLVAEPVLALTRKDAERIYVGKERDRHTVPQDQINTLLADLAKQGKRVLRLKGGDPFIFGRGGEEIETLSAQGIPFQIVPGITAATGCASYAGIPLTHRDYAHSCLFVTGHMKDGGIDLNWKALVQPRQTIAIYMGVHSLQVLSQQLIAHGMNADMPAALIERGTMPQQRVLTGTVTTLPTLIRDGNVQAPSLLLVGEVVRLRDKLAWFESTKRST